MGTKADLVYERIATRYSAPAWACFREVRSTTGFSRGVRYADAVAFSMYPSHGLEVHGIEIKVNRSDWLSELRSPDKADEIARYCDRWFVATDDLAVVPIEEVPPFWGLLLSKGGVLRTVRNAQINPDRKPPSTAFMASVMRSMHKNVREIERRAYRAGVDSVKVERSTPVDYVPTQRDLAQLRERVKVFEEKSGISIDSYNIGKIAEVVALAREGLEPHVHLFERVAEMAGRIGAHAKESLSAIGAIQAAIESGKVRGNGEGTTGDRASSPKPASGASLRPNGRRRTRA